MALACNLISDSHYHPLSRQTRQIRLLTILAGEGRDPVNCILRRAELDTEFPLRYETISYVWGDPSKRARIHIGGVEINVPASSEAAIRRVRMRDQDRTVWIDAVCINQLDTAERGAQVAIMTRVYRQAQCNLIHLGNDESNVAAGVKRALRNAQQRVINDVCKIDRGLFCELPIIANLYQLPWFIRVWNLQEVVLANRNVCFWGSSEFPFEWIVDYNTWLTDFTDSGPPEVYIDKLMEQVASSPVRRSISGMRRLRETYEQVAGLCTMDHMAHSLDIRTLYMPLIAQELLATDPRDHVFALAGLTALLHGLVDIPLGLKADYTKSPMEVYRDATRYIFQTSAWTIILYMIRHRSQAEITLGGKPSWTFLWNRSWGRTKEHDREEFPLNQECTAGLRSREIIYRHSIDVNSSGHSQVLTLKGYLIGTVASCSSIFTKDRLNDYKQLQPGLTAIERAAARYGVFPASSNARERSSIVPMLLTAWPNNEITAGHDLSREQQLVLTYQAFLAFVKRHNTMPPDRATLGPNTSFDAFLSSEFAHMLKRSLGGRRFFSTHDGMLGLGPHVIQEGDVVAVTLGMAWPCILRPVGRMYQILGAAYVYELMQGEVFDTGLEVQTIDLC